VLAPLAVSVLSGARIYWLAIILLNLTAFHADCVGLPRRGLSPPSGGWPADRVLSGHVARWVLGGVFAGLAAPHLFSNVYEYPILIVAALAIMPGIYSGGPRTLCVRSRLGSWPPWRPQRCGS